MQNQITYLILAGGRGQRMNGQDKGLMLWHKRPMIEHVMKNLQITPGQTIISANRNISFYRQHAKSVVEDQITGYQGPLAGILSAMQQCGTDYILCVPCDSPSPPQNLQQKLSSCMKNENKTAAICHDGERLQPLFCLLSCQYETMLNDFLKQGRRKVHDFMQLLDPAVCDFSAEKGGFRNFNRADDMQDD